MTRLVIAVDGPAASGKGTIAHGLAEHYGLPCLDTGLLYRAVGVLAQAKTGGVSEAAATEAARALDPAHLEDPELRTRAAGELASQAAVYPGVRAALLDFQRAFAARPGGAVIDGRDIGTVIAPDATAKLFVTATPKVRAERRWQQLSHAGRGGQLRGGAGRHPPARRARLPPLGRPSDAGGGRRLARHLQNEYIPGRRCRPPHRRGGARTQRS